MNLTQKNMYYKPNCNFSILIVNNNKMFKYTDSLIVIFTKTLIIKLLHII